MAKRRANGEGSLFQRKGKDGKPGLWAAQYTDNVGKKRTLYGKTQSEVKNKLKEAIRNCDDGLSLDKWTIVNKVDTKKNQEERKALDNSQ